MYITYCQLHYNLLEHPSPIMIGHNGDTNAENSTQKHIY